MKFLKEAYGQSQALDDFIYNLENNFSTIYKVTIKRPDNISDNFEERYFALEDAAQEYYTKLKEDLKKYDWDTAEVTLDEVKIKLDIEELDSYIYDKDIEIDEEQ